MAENCGDVLSLTDLQTAKKHGVFEAEVITGKAGGVASGENIDYATNPVTGQMQKTLPAVLRDAGYTPADFDFVTGGTLAEGQRSHAVLWPLSAGGDGDYYYWEGELPKVIPAGSTPESTGGVAKGAWRPVGDLSLRTELTTVGEGKGADMLPLVQGGSVQDSIHAITPEMFGAKGDGAADDITALQAAIDYALKNNVRRVVGMGNYKISKTLLIGSSQGIGTGGVTIDLSQLRADAAWPANMGLFDATPMILMGNASGNDTNIELSIGYLDGAGKADGLQPTGFGFSLTRIHFGHATNCIRVIGTGKQQWSNASVYITGNSWSVNWLGLHLERGTSGTSPINEGWNIDVGFTWSNRYGGFLMRGGSQYAKIAGDFDFNGNYVSLLEVNSFAGVTRGMALTNGTTACPVLSFYSYRGKNYIALAENKVTARNQSSYAAGDTLTGAPSAISVVAVTTAQTNASRNNYFDIWHDFQGEPFAAINIRAGYCGGVYGALQHTSRIFYNNNFDGRPDNWRGLGVAHSGQTLTMYDKARSDSALITSDGESFNIDRRLYMKLRLYEGVPVAKTVPRSATEFVHFYTFGDASYDKYIDEGSMYEITLKGNFAGVYGRWLIFIKGTNLQIVEEKYNNTVIAYRFDGLNFSLRQAAQPYINMTINIRRV